MRSYARCAGASSRPAEVRSSRNVQATNEHHTGLCLLTLEGCRSVAKAGNMRRSWLRVAAALALVLCLTIGNARGQSLRREAERSGLLVGTAVRPEQLSEQAFAERLAREYNTVEPEDAMKWWVVRPDAATFNFGPADRLVDFARLHGMKVRGHTLVWDHSNPKWLGERKWTPQELSRLLQEHITREVGHFRGEVFAWDVVNEAFDEHGHLRPSIWYDQPGIKFAQESTRDIEEAFQWAHAADPDALLFYNEAEVETYDAKADAIAAMVQDFRRRGVPIDGVGLQMHQWGAVAGRWGWKGGRSGGYGAAGGGLPADRAGMC